MLLDHSDASDAALINFDGFRWSGLMFTTFKLLVNVLVHQNWSL